VRELPRLASGPAVVTVRADFEKQLIKKGYKKTDHTFLDMMLWKGRAPSAKAQFCTEHLKLWPIKFYLTNNFAGQPWVMYTGIRAGESERRSKMSAFSYNDFFDCESILPMLYNTEEEQFEILEHFGVPPNPLYALGYGRVGCFPCIHANKKELKLLPDWAWDRLEYYESQVGRSWFTPGVLPKKPDGYVPKVSEIRDWCTTSWGGSQFQLFTPEKADAPSCMTGWMACE
jgi:3'-phosphoadenosine 5'-phosphosulfate sulfotransferase (PAPS reductase)/FAD synthetase